MSRSKAKGTAFETAVVEVFRAAGHRWGEPVTAPRVFGLDLSLTATGIAHPDGTLDTIRVKSTGMERLHAIRERLLDAGLVAPPDLVVVEGYAFGRPNQAVQLGELGGLIRWSLYGALTPYLDVPPATLKTYATGRGNATKPDMRMELFRRTGVDVRDDNQVDAAWLRLLGLDGLGHPEVALPQSHRRALDKLTFPADLLAHDGRPEPEATR